MKPSAAAAAHPNIAFIKYWGNADASQRIPLNGSISMNLAGLETRTRVTFDPELEQDHFTLNNREIRDQGLLRVSRFLDQVRQQAQVRNFARVESINTFPTGAGIASSAGAFAALALAASRAAGLLLEEEALSRLARLGSGSACRSIPGGFVEWLPGNSPQTSYAETIAPPDHWELIDLVAVINREHKTTGSTPGHALAETSPIQDGRVDDAERRLNLCRRAILTKDFLTFASVVEQDCNLMHAVMLTSSPPLIYWEPETVSLIKAVQRWRSEGARVCYTIDAGPNVHVICPGEEASRIKNRLIAFPGVKEVLESSPGGGAVLLDPETAAV